MKILNLILSVLLAANLFAQSIPEKEVKTEVKEVTVFLEGAQISRQKTVDVSAGISTIKFVNLSPFIDAKSVQVKVNGSVTVLGVNHQLNYLDLSKKSEEVKALEAKIDELDDKIKLEKTYLSVLTEELEFLKINRSIGGVNTGVNLTDLKLSSVFYTEKVKAIMLEEIERNKKISDLQKQQKNYQNQLWTISSKKEFASGEILVKTKAELATKASFELSYFVNNTGWFPSYDVRAKSINDPVEIIYKANLHQDTKVDWKDVKLTFSSINPNTSNVKPELKPYFLGYHTRPPVYRSTEGTVSGQVFGTGNKPLAGVTVVVKGTTIGAITDAGGNYSLTMPASGSNQLVFTFIGYESQTLPVRGSTLNVSLNEMKSGIEEVVAIGYGRTTNYDITGSIASVAPGPLKGLNTVKKRETESIAIPFEKSENQTSITFEIKTPYSVKSDNKSSAVDMTVYQVPAFYQYISIPKIDKVAYLIANITDWEKYSLLEGEANIFFEETYIGKSLLDIRYATDTLQLSLGQDKNVSVNREKVKEHVSKQFIGSKKEEIKAWKITVRNNKSQKINMIVLDQIPVSNNEEIEVELMNSTGAKLNTETGEIKWEFELEPANKKEFNLKYSVKYPKSKNLIIE